MVCMWHNGCVAASLDWTVVIILLQSTISLQLWAYHKETMAEASSTVRVAKLRRGGNWALWSAHVRMYLLKMDLQGYLSQKELKSDDEEKGDRLCKANLLLLMDGAEKDRRQGFFCERVSNAQMHDCGGML
jgi:hypothetical protein